MSKKLKGFHRQPDIYNRGEVKQYSFITYPKKYFLNWSFSIWLIQSSGIGTYDISMSKISEIPLRKPTVG